MSEAPRDGSAQGGSVWWIPLVLAGLCLLLGGGLAAVGASMLSSANAVASWPSTEGLVVRSEVHERTWRNPRDYNDFRRYRETDLAYTYAVAGQQLTGTQLDPTGVDGTRGPELAARFPVGARVRVWYDPANPSRAGLQGQASGVTRYVLLGAGALVCLLALPFLWLARKMR